VLTCAGYLARVAYVLGDLERAESQGQLALQAADAIAPTFYMDWPASQLAMILVERGAPEEAERVLQHCGYAGAELPRGTFAAHFLAEARIALWLAQGQIDRAVADAGLLWRMVRGRGSRPMLATRGLSALALLAAGRRDEARAVAETELQASARWGLASGQGMALRALGVVEGGTDGIALLQQAVDQLEPTPRRLELIRALVDLGSALRLDRRRSDAQEPLRRALELASAAGARALRERARTELLLCGARPRRDERAGRDALTAAERRVAEMVAAGHGNTQVAQALFVTRRTVETHLSSIYRKLGISGRAQLAEAMQAELTSVG
jgi:DNA-binding CsgD family transcriptional regulator